MVGMLKGLEAEEKALTEELEAEKAKQHAPDVSPADITALAQQMRTLKGDALTNLRSRLKLAIASVVSKIEVTIVHSANSRIRSCAAEITLKDGRKRFLFVHCEHGKPSVSFGHVQPMTPAEAEAFLADPDGNAGIYDPDEATRQYADVA